MHSAPPAHGLSARHRPFPSPPRHRSWPAASPIQERNLKYPEGGPEASRITATSRRKLGTLGSLLDALRSSLEAPQYAGL